MIWSFVKAYRKQLIIMAVLAVLVISGVVAWNVHGSRQYDAGYAQAKEDRKTEDERVRQHYEQEKSINEREAQQRIDQAMVSYITDKSSLNVKCPAKLAREYYLRFHSSNSL